MSKIPYVKHDGGRAESCYRGSTGDCCVRAIAIASGRNYEWVYDRINELAQSERKGKRKKKISNARTGVFRGTAMKLLTELGFEWVPVMKIGTGCTMHLHADEIPSGTLVVSLSRHYAAVIDGVLYDTHDSSRGGTRAVYGYWKKGLTT